MVIAMPQISTPVTLTLSENSKDAYARRYNQLVRAAKRKIAAETGQTVISVPITPAKLVDFLIGKKSSYAATSWRQVRRSVTWSLQELASKSHPKAAQEIIAQIERLRDEHADPYETREAMTSSTKAKKVPEDDLVLIEEAALATRAKCKTSLVLYFKVGVLTGLRLCEWASAELRPSTREGFAWMLVVANAKATNQRSHGPFRTLYFADLDPQTVDDIRAWIEIARARGYERRLATIGRLLWTITRKLWPDSDEWPTLYTTRHVAVAAWKAHFLRKDQTDAERLDALATIAALMGHGSDATASRHYARASAGRHAVVPSADPEQVVRVRRVIDLNWFETLIASSGPESDDAQSLSATPSPWDLPP
jgi:integrase